MEIFSRVLPVVEYPTLILIKGIQHISTCLTKVAGCLYMCIYKRARDGNPNPTTFLDPERIRIRIRNLNCGFGWLIFTTIEALKKIYFHSISHAYFRLG